MRVFFDTSVFVSLCLGEHEHHRASQNVFLGLGRNYGFCAAHSLGEVYSVLTRMPPPHRVPADQAMLFVHELTSRLRLVVLEGDEYVTALARFASSGIIGGAIYDGLLAACALKAKADVIYTWNARHFCQFGSEIEKRLRKPTE